VLIQKVIQEYKDIIIIFYTTCYMVIIISIALAQKKFKLTLLKVSRAISNK